MKIKPWKNEQNGDTGFSYYCQGCKHTHMIRVSGNSQGPRWQWDGNVERPTFSPSVLSTSGHYVTGQPQPPDCWHCNDLAENPDNNSYMCRRCHTFIKDGMVQFLDDCTHEFAGQTLELPDMPEVYCDH